MMCRAYPLQKPQDPFDEGGLKVAVEKLGGHDNKEESETAIKTLTAYARNILQNPGKPFAAMGALGNGRVARQCPGASPVQMPRKDNIPHMTRTRILERRPRQVPPHQEHECRADWARAECARGQGGHGEVGMEARS